MSIIFAKLGNQGIRVIDFQFHQTFRSTEQNTFIQGYPFTPPVFFVIFMTPIRVFMCSTDIALACVLM